MGTVGLMSAKRDPRAPVKLSPGDLREHKDYPKLAAMVLERDSLGGELKMECGSIKAAKRILPKRFQEYNKLRSQVRASKTRLERLALKDFRTDWFEVVDHDEIKQQLRGEAASTFVFIKPEFDCQVREAIAEVCQVREAIAEVLVPRNWWRHPHGQILCVRCPPSICKDPRSIQSSKRGRKTCAHSASAMILYGLRKSLTHFTRLGLSGGI